MAEDQEARLRELERNTAILGETMKGFQATLIDIRQQIQGFLEKAQVAIAIESRVDRVEEDAAELFRKTDAIFKLIDSHKSEYAVLKAEHAVCINGRTSETSWWKDRLGRLLDAGVIGVIVWLLAMYKGH